jgi:hypothetical protein
VNIIHLATEITDEAARYKAAFGMSPTVVIVPPFVLIELWEHDTFTGFIAGIRVIESTHVTKPLVAHVDPHTLGKLARIDA